MSTENGCFTTTPNALTGFPPPSKETIDQWIEILKSKGLKEGSPVRLIGGTAEGKYFPFTFDREKLLINDCGIGPLNQSGWFYRVSDEACVYPCFEVFSSEFIDVEAKTCAIGFKSKGQNYILTYDIEGKPFDRKETKTSPIDCLDGCNVWAMENISGGKDELYHFHKLTDLWAWLEQNY